MAAPTPFRFLDLPAELRTIIYEYHFQDHMIDFRLPPEDPRPHAKVRPPSLLLANRQIYSEALGIYYESTTVTFSPFSRIRDLPLRLPRGCWTIFKRVQVDFTSVCRRIHHRTLADHQAFHGADFSKVYEELETLGAEELAEMCSMKCDFYYDMLSDLLAGGAA